MRKRKQSISNLLAEVVSEDRSALGGALNQFMSDVRRWAKIEESGVESIELLPLGRPLHREDLSLLFPELERLLEKLIAKKEGQA